MAFNLKSILAPLKNGKRATAEEIETVIADLARERSAAQQEIERLNTSLEELSLDGDDRALDAAERQRSSQERIITRVTLALPRLQDQLAILRSEARAARIEHHRRQSRAAHEEAIPTFLAAIAANEKMKHAFAAAERELGAGDAARLVGNFSFLLPGFTGEVVDHYVAVTRRDGEAAASLAAPVRVAPRAVADPIFSSGAYGAGNTARTEKNLPPRQSASPRPPSPAKPLRPLYDETAGEGERRVRILRSGYEDLAGRACRLGDTIALPKSIADKAVASGACDFADLTPPRVP